MDEIEFTATDEALDYWESEKNLWKPKKNRLRFLKSIGIDLTELSYPYQ